MPDLDGPVLRSRWRGHRCADPGSANRLPTPRWHATCVATGHRCASQGWWAVPCAGPIPWRTAIPRSSMKARIWLMMPVRCDTNALAYPMQRLQVQLLSGLGRHELHRRALHGFGNRVGIIEVVLLSLAIGADIFGRHQPGIVTKRCEFAAQVMGADAGFHADQARRYIGEPRFHLAA